MKLTRRGLLGSVLGALAASSAEAKLLRGHSPPSLPPGVTSVTVMNDMMIPTSQAGVGSVNYPTNGYTIQLLTTAWGAITSFNAQLVTVYVRRNGFDQNRNPVVWTAAIQGVARIFKTAPDTGKYTDEAISPTGGVHFTLSEQLYLDTKTDHTLRPYGDTVEMITIGAGAINGVSSALTIPGELVIRADDRPYDPIPWKHDIPPFGYVTANGALDVGWMTDNEFHRSGQFVACVEAWARSWDGSVVGPSSYASAPTKSRWSTGAGASGGSGLTYDEWLTTVSFAGMPHGKVGIASRIYPWVGPATNSYDAGIGDDFDAVASQNLYAYYPAYHDLDGDRTPIYAKVNYDFTGRLSSDTAGIFDNLAAAKLDTGYRSFLAAGVAARTYNNTLRPVGKRHNDPDNLFIYMPDTAGSAGADPGSYSMRESGTVNCTYLPVTYMSDSGVYSAACRIRSINADGTVSPEAAKVNPFSKQRIVGVWFDCQNTGSGGGLGKAIRFASGSPGASAPAGSNPVNVVYSTFVDCYSQANSGTAGTEVPISETVITYVYGGKFVENPLRNGFALWAGSVVMICHWQDGNRGVIDGTFALGCKLTGGIVQMAQNSGVDSAPGVPTTKYTLQYNGLFLTNSIGGVGIANLAFGRGEGMLACTNVGCVFGRYENASNTMMDWSSDSILPGYLYFRSYGMSMLGKAAQGTNNRVNWHYQDRAWLQIRKEGIYRYAVVSASSMKESGFNAEGESTPPVFGSPVPWTSTGRFFAGQVVYDPTGGLLPQTGAPVYQVPWFLPSGQRNLGVPVNTPLSNTDYYWNANYVAGTRVGAQCRRNGNLRFRQTVGCSGLNTGDAIQLGAVPGQYQELGNVAPLGLPSPTLWGSCPSDTRYVNDTSGPGGNMATLDARPAPGGPLMGLRPAGRTWDTRDMLDQLRAANAVGPFGALEAA